MSYVRLLLLPYCVDYLLAANEEVPLLFWCRNDLNLCVEAILLGDDNGAVLPY